VHYDLIQKACVPFKRKINLETLKLVDDADRFAGLPAESELE
jgi:hypothetical protein